MGDKYRRIHHFVELLAPPLRALPNCKELRVVDMGSGKGYLTFAFTHFSNRKVSKSKSRALKGVGLLSTSVTALLGSVNSVTCGLRSERSQLPDSMV
jgi:hypothetical protein